MITMRCVAFGRKDKAGVGQTSSVPSAGYLRLLYPPLFCWPSEMNLSQSFSPNMELTVLARPTFQLASGIRESSHPLPQHLGYRCIPPHLASGCLLDADDLNRSPHTPQKVVLCLSSCPMPTAVLFLC